MEAEHAGKQHSGEALNTCIELLGGAIEETTNGSQLILYVGQFALQLQEILISLQVGILYS